MQTYLSAEPWQREIGESREFKALIDTLGTPLQRDGKGVYFPYSRGFSSELEKLWLYAKSKTKSEDIAPNLKFVKALVQKRGTNLTGESLVRSLVTDIKFEGMEAEKEEEELETKSAESEGEIKAQKMIEKMKKDLEKLRKENDELTN